MLHLICSFHFMAILEICPLPSTNTFLSSIISRKIFFLLPLMFKSRRWSRCLYCSLSDISRLCSFYLKELKAGAFNVYNITLSFIVCIMFSSVLLFFNLLLIHILPGSLSVPFYASFLVTAF